MKWTFILLTLLVILCEISIAKRSSGGRSRTKSSGGSSWWGRRNNKGSSSGSSGSAGEVPKAKASAPGNSQYVGKKAQTSTNQQKPPIGWNIKNEGSLKQKSNKHVVPTSDQHKRQNIGNSYNKGQRSNQYSKRVESQHVRKENSQIQQSASKQPVGWNVPGQQNSNSNQQQRNPVWNSPNSKQNVAAPSAPPASKGWASGYQSKSNEGIAKKETSKVQQSSAQQPQPPPPGWNVNGQNNAPNANSAWKPGYQTHGAAPPAYPHHNAAPPGYNGQTSWGAPPAYSGHAPNYGGYGGVGHQQSGGYGGYGGGGYHPQHGGYNPGYGGVGGYGGGMGGYGGGMGGYGHGGGGFGSPGFGGGYYPMKKKSFFSASTIGSVVAGMLVYNMASSLISNGLGLKRPYTVVNYYNQEPGKKVEEIKLPSNVLMLCDNNMNQMCQGTQSVCTQNGTVLCVAAMNQAAPCDQGGNQALCVNTTVPCANANDPLCQNSTQKEKLQADVNVPCVTNLTLDVNLVDKDQTLPNTKYTYCVTTMAVAGPDYKLCEDLKDSNDYSSVLNGAQEWYLETDGLKRNYSIYTHERPMESNGEINMPVTVLLKCTDNAKKLCPPGTIAVCTTFNEVMCMALTTETEECPEKSAHCVKSTIPCPEETKEAFCQNKTEGSNTISMDIPCFANITINAPFPKFSLTEFNGTLPDLATTSSYSYNFNYCVVTLGLPGGDFDLCITKEAKEKQEKEQRKS